MIRKTKNGISLLEFHNLQSNDITHASFLRHGGVSPGPYHSLNCSLMRVPGDSLENILENQRRACGAIDLPQFAILQQEHGKKVVEITHLNKNENPIADAAITNERELPLAVSHADCQAVLFFDPIQKAIGIAHVGWRGNVQNILVEVVKALECRYGSKPRDLKVGISPSLGPHASEFINYRQELPPSFWPYQVKPLYFDLWAISRDQLIQSGVLAENIEIASLCTRSNPQDFFSYRREKLSGRHISVIALL